jgi:hypothetical protein
MPHSETLKKLAAAHRMHVEKYVAQLAKLTAGMTKDKR